MRLCTVLILNFCVHGMGISDVLADPFQELRNSVFNKDLKTEGFLILEGQKIIFEDYAEGYNSKKKHPVLSVTKSITTVLLGTAIQAGGVALDQSVCEFIDKHTLPSFNHCLITIRDLATFSSGLRWREIYNSTQSKNSSPLQLLFGDGIPDSVNFVLNHPLEHPPGEVFRYSTGDLSPIMKVLKVAFANEHLVFPKTLLFDPIGIKNITWEVDPKETFIGGSQIFTTPRELAKIGQLLLNDGKWEGDRVLPKGWRSFLSAVPDSFRYNNADSPDPFPSGAGWWLNISIPEQNIKQPWPFAPDDLFFAWGHWGQFVFVIPSKNLVIVRLGHDRRPTAYAIGPILRASLKFVESI